MTVVPPSLSESASTSRVAPFLLSSVATASKDDFDFASYAVLMTVDASEINSVDV